MVLRYVFYALCIKQKKDINNRLTSAQKGCFFIAKKGRYYATCKENWGGSYSTTETFTGDYWIDGKKIYRKTITQQLTSNTGAVEATYTHGIADVDTIMCDYSHSTIKFPSVYNNMPYINATNSVAGIGISALSSTSYTISTGTNRSSLTAYITFLYTKTTD